MNKTQIHAEIVGHSLSPQGDELISVLCTFPRIILAEVNTHRMLSKNTSSSRAIPFHKMVEVVQNDPFVPIAWQKQHSGMQGIEYFENTKQLTEDWTTASKIALKEAKKLHDGAGITKQLANRLLEPFMWTTMLITGSKEGWDNFFNLRCPQYSFKSSITGEETIHKTKKELLSVYKDTNMDYATNIEWLTCNKGQAEIHMMALAECIWDAMNESTPKQLKAGQWHIPFEDKMDIPSEEYIKITGKVVLKSEDLTKIKVKSSVAMAAHTSYTTVGNEPVKSYEKWIELHDKLIAYDPPHSSPMEHCARAMSDEEYYTFVKGRIIEENKQEDGTCDSLNWIEASGWCNNLKGFIPYRYFIDNKIEL